MEDIRTLVGVLFILIYALLSRRLDRWWISMPMTMIVLGFLVGPGGFGLITLDLRSELVRSAAELTLALMLFHDAVRIDLAALRSGYRIPLRLLGIGLPAMIVIGTAVAYGMMPNLGLVGAALLATMLAPTDAALGDAVVSDERLPVSIRQGLNVESGLNDGLSVPIFLVLLALAADPTAAHTGALVTEMARQIGFGILGGALIGGLGGLLFRLSGARAMLDSWRRIAVMAIALGCFVCAAVLGGSGFIGAFVGGILFGLASNARSNADNALTGSIGTIFDAVSFLLVGIMLLPFALQHLGALE
ncbi:MAG: cation:proton antiporter, partial [Coriobacteriia bacterium]|nr:cation:proton antiporter [Coriobacteriia bacterium]